MLLIILHSQDSGKKGGLNNFVFAGIISIPKNVRDITIQAVKLCKFSVKPRNIDARCKEQSVPPKASLNEEGGLCQIKKVDHAPIRGKQC